MHATLSGIIILSSVEQLKKAKSPIYVTVFDIDIFDSEMQDSNAELPIFTTPFGILTLLRE